MHGDEDVIYTQNITLPTIKALSITNEEDVHKASEYEVDYFLFDAPGDEFRGGSGNSFDWTLLAQANIPNNKVILAGGLNAGNVNKAVNIVQPYMVDVSSGVETEKRKDAEKIQAFIKAVRDEER